MTQFTCPPNDRGPQPDADPPGRPDIVGCGRTFDAVPDDEGLVDCPFCGIWFRSTDTPAPHTATT